MLKFEDGSQFVEKSMCEVVVKMDRLTRMREGRATGRKVRANCRKGRATSTLCPNVENLDSVWTYDCCDPTHDLYVNVMRP
jgi:hypothetical protein